jgi:predicted nucleic acid-binding protein
LHLREEDIFAVRWSQAILDEARQSLIDRGKPADKVDRRLRAMQEAFPDAEVTGHERLISGLHLPDPNDRHVLAAAIAGGANQIVTANVRDFPEDVLARYDLEAVSPDTFLLSALYSYPELTVATIQQRAAELTRPRIGVTGLLEALRKSGAPQFADAVAAEILGP